ncbi:hypothetical protein [Bartonella harrusi]|uniref:DUF4134 domain-containing protein n=1 Tax=Bartonella harrusi TaxID=2961895 RepID=A0ABY5EQS7_9HYPH|nr:hypothetical protein [Bartonella harrusi]UTO27751.1 hypothetical protein NMK50_05720 [Bartonella harrusi]
MVKLFKKYSLSVFIATAFFLSQIANVHANHLKNSPQKKDVNYVIKQVANVTYTTVGTTSLSVPVVNYGTIYEDAEDAIEGKFEKVVANMTLALGFFAFGSVISFIIGIIKDIVLMFK